MIRPLVVVVLLVAGWKLLRRWIGREPHAGNVAMMLAACDFGIVLATLFVTWLFGNTR